MRDLTPDPDDGVESDHGNPGPRIELDPRDQTLWDLLEAQRQRDLELADIDALMREEESDERE